MQQCPLGQSTVSMTLDTYSHVLEGMGDVAAEAIERALGAVLRG